VKRTIREFSMLKKGDRVAVGLSGGKDSTVLLHMLCKLRKALPFELNAILIDEGILGYREYTVPVAKKECGRLGVLLTIVKFSSKFKTIDSIMESRKAGHAKKGACTYCGVFRRSLLNLACKKIGANKLAIGHNLDDMAQTVLMNLMRNEPSRLARFGLAGGLFEDFGFVQRIKPLAQIPEREIALYAALVGIPIHYQECPYAHEAFRQQVRVLLNSLEEKYPGTKQRIFNSFLSIQRSLEKTARAEPIRAPEKCAQCGEPSSSRLCMACSLLGEIEASFINPQTKSP
jgi:uncharacterized protein (TIGR00269 family)